VLRAAAGEQGRALGAVALGAAALVHWQFALLFTMLLGIVALASLPGSLRDRRQGRPLAETPAGRVGTAIAGGVGLGAAALLLGAPGIPRAPIGLSRSSVDRHLSDQLARYRLPGVAIAAAVGGWWLAADAKDPGRRRAAWLLVPWALVPAAAALLYAAGRTVPLQRALSFALAIPVLGGIGLVAAVLRTRRALGGVAGGAVAVVAAAALLLSITFAWETWRTRRPWSEDRALAEFQALGSYVTDAGRPAIVVVDKRAGEGDFGTVRVMRRLRAELPGDLVLRTTVYVGDPDLLADARPTLRPEVPGFDQVSQETWDQARALLSHDPVIVILRSHLQGFAKEVGDHPAWRTNGWMAVVSGPPPPSEHPTAPERPSAGSLAAWWAVSFAVITFVGVGWAARFGSGSFELRMAIAPATGLAALTVVGLLLGRLGVRPGGAGGVCTVVLLAGAGALAALGHRRSERSA
jgi:hypothetical protein